MQSSDAKKKIFHSANTIAITLRDAWRSGRVIVPVVGAGLSADAGVPPISPLVHYLVSLNCFVNNGVFCSAPLGTYLKQTMEVDPRDHYKDKIHEFISDHGWIDRFSLQQELHTAYPTSNEYNLKTQESLIDLVRRMKPQEFTAEQHFFCKS